MAFVLKPTKQSIFRLVFILEEVCILYSASVRLILKEKWRMEDQPLMNTWLFLYTD